MDNSYNNVVKSLIIAFSMYSKIPMPQFAWKEEDMKYILCFFPWVGAVIGVMVYFWSILCERYGIGIICYTLISAAIPLILTGGIHVDGFMDTMDAFHSYQPVEKKLEILKDAHIGAFSVIILAAYGLIYIGAFSEIKEVYLLKIICAGFVLSRCLSGIAVVSFRPAKKEGLIYLFADNARKNIVKATLIFQGGACVAFMLWQSIYAGSIVVVVAWCSFLYYYFRCKRELGGITGDTAGYFVLLCEVSIVVVAAVMNTLI